MEPMTPLSSVNDFEDSLPTTEPKLKSLKREASDVELCFDEELEMEELPQLGKEDKEDGPGADSENSANKLEPAKPDKSEFRLSPGKEGSPEFDGNLSPTLRANPLICMGTESGGERTPKLSLGFESQESLDSECSGEGLRHRP